MASPEEWVDWIEEEGGLIESLPRAEIRRRNLLHRVTGTFVFHPDGRLFIHQRTATKDVYPGKFDVMVGGTVVSGESFEANACREIAEELGVRGVPIYALFQHRYQDESTNSLIQVYACLYGGPVTLQPEEVASGFWGAITQAEDLVRADQVCPDSCQGWRRYLERYGAGRQFAGHVAADGLEPIDCAPYSGAC
ncbi:MAG: NUDIX domain-containing protein [SAR324 cluster bacterium]|nr:NUDIX domain-containing protein [SAR324 cluster bacterium]